MTEEEFEKLKKERDHLERLIASVGSATPMQWHMQLDKINKKIGQKDYKGASKYIKRTNKDIWRWVLMIILALLMIIEIVHWYLMKLEKQSVFESEAFQVNVEYPRFICCHEYYEIFICIERKKGINIELEIQPPSNEFWIRGDNWHKNIDIYNVSRNDWRPEMLYKPKESFLRILFSPGKWPNLYPREEMAIVLKNENSKQIRIETITFRAIRFYYQLTGIIAILIIVLRAHKYRLTSVFQYMLKK